MDCLEFLWSLGAGSDDDEWVPHNDVIHEDLDTFSFEHHPLFGPSSESDTMGEESVTTLAVDSDVDRPCEHFFIGEPRAKRNPTEDPPPYVAPPVIQPRRVPVRVYDQMRGEWAFELL